MPNKGTIPRVCQQCGADFLALVGQVNVGRALYCSNVCRSLAHRRPPSGALLSADGTTAYVPLFDRHGMVRANAIVDADDVEDVGQYRWHLSKGYAVMTKRIDGRDHRIRLHRYLCGLTEGDGMEVDHIDRNRLNCRRTNLRVHRKATGANAQNKPSYHATSSAHRGVSWHKKTQKWMAYVKSAGVNHYLGVFASEHEAAEVARAARERLLPFAVD
jgi:hypothetical protein